MLSLLSFFIFRHSLLTAPSTLPLHDALPISFKASLPSGGEALVDRMLAADVDAVISPGRDSVVDGPAPWAAHLLMSRRHLDLGTVLSAALPEVAVEGGEQGMAGAVPEAGAGGEV